MTIKTMPTFGNGDGKWSKMKDLLYLNYELKNIEGWLNRKIVNIKGF